MMVVTVTSIQPIVSADDSEKGRSLGMTPWPMYGNGQGHPGYSQYSTEKNDGKLDWKYSAGNIEINSPVIGSDNSIYFGGYEGNLYALNPDGTLKWKYAMESSCATRSAVIDEEGIIYFGGWHPSYLYAMKPDGALKWKQKIDEDITSGIMMGTNGVLYFTSAKGSLYAVDDTGDVLWTYRSPSPDLGSYPTNTPSLGPDGTIYYCQYRGGLRAINPEGTLKWSKFSGDSLFSPTIGEDGTLYFGDSDLYAMSPDGTVLWTYPVGSNGITQVSLDPSGKIYFAVRNSYYGTKASLFSLFPNGTLNWKFTSPNPDAGEPTVSKNGDVFFLSETLFALNSSGKVRWTFNVTGGYYGPVITASGGILFGSPDSYIYSIGGGEIQAVPPGPPTDFVALGGDTLATLSWKPPTFSGGAPVTGYKVYRGEVKTNLVVIAALPAGNLTYTDHNVTNGKTYYYDVRAVNSIGDGDLVYDPSIAPAVVPSTDKVLPTLVFSTPKDGQVMKSSSITITGLASDNVQVAKVEVQLNGQNWTAASGTASWQKSLVLSEGMNKILVRVTDSTGNVRVGVLNLTYKPDGDNPPGTPGPVVNSTSVASTSVMIAMVLVLTSIVLVVVAYDVIRRR